MTRTVGVLIDSPVPLEELAPRVAELTAASLSAPRDPGVWELRFGEVTACLSASGWAEGQEGFLSRYRYALAATMAEGATAADSIEVRALRGAARALVDADDLAALLVVDLQNRRPAAGAEAGR